MKPKFHYLFHWISTVNHALRQSYLCTYSHPISLSNHCISGAQKSHHGHPLSAVRNSLLNILTVPHQLQFENAQFCGNRAP
jgi:hypothetical protein